MNNKVVIIDYKLGNLFSVKHACDHVGINSVVSSDASFISKADALILPGVGAFKEGIHNLNDLGLSSIIIEKVKQGTPLFGICLGLQMLFTESEEFGNTNGLDIISGKIIRFPNLIDSLEIKVPQIGWNKINQQNTESWKASPLSSIEDGSFMYFVHSYYAKPDKKAEILTHTNYGGLKYCSAVFNNENVFATQFHPEKSGKKGVDIYRKWAKNYKLIK